MSDDPWLEAALESEEVGSCAKTYSNNETEGVRYGALSMAINYFKSSDLSKCENIEAAEIVNAARAFEEFLKNG